MMRVVLLGWLLWLSGLSGVRADVSLLPAKDLQKDAKVAEAQNIPIVLLFVAKGLKSTEHLKEEAILPELRSGDYDRLALFREVAVNSKVKTIDFYGVPTSNETLKVLYNLTSLPAVVIVNSDGDPLVETLISGAYDYYGYYLRQHLNQALKVLGNPKRIAEQ